jgi:hypothetical protein
MPVLPQILKAQVASLEWIIDQWHAYGIDCVFPSYSSWEDDAGPGDFPLNAPYGLYTADDCGGNYAAWSPREHSYRGCIEPVPPEPPDGGDDLATKITTQDGVTASINRLRDLDPGGTSLVKIEDPKKPGKMVWPSIDTLTIPLDQQKAYDKLERALSILVEDHDASL